MRRMDKPFTRTTVQEMAKNKPESGAKYVKEYWKRKCRVLERTE